MSKEVISPSKAMVLTPDRTFHWARVESISNGELRLQLEIKNSASLKVGDVIAIRDVLAKCNLSGQIENNFSLS